MSAKPGAVEGIHAHNVVASSLNHNGFFVLLAHNESHCLGATKRRNESIVGNDVQLLDLLALNVGGALSAVQGEETGSADLKRAA